MSANSKIRMHVEELFLSAPKSHRTIELKEELIVNLQEKYADLISQGRDEELAYDMVISSIGDIDELIRSLQEKMILDPDVVQGQRHKSAMFISIAVGLYVMGIVPFLFMVDTGDEGIGLGITFAIWAVATMLLVYNALSKPKYSKHQDTIVENFKEYSRGKTNRKSLRGTVSSIIWTSTVFIFLAGGMMFGRWGTLWLVFLLAPVVQQIANLLLRDDDPER